MGGDLWATDCGYFVPVSSVFYHVSFVFLAKALPGGFTLLFPGLQHVKGMDVTMVDIYLRIDSGLLEILHEGERLLVEWLPVGDEGIAGRKIRVISLAGRGGVLADVLCPV